MVSRHPDANEIILVNDPYDIEVCIKDSEHQRRELVGESRFTDGPKNVYMKRDDKLLSSTDLKNMFKNCGNKIWLEEFFKDEFRLYVTRYPSIRFLYSVMKCMLLTTSVSTPRRIRSYFTYIHRLEKVGLRYQSLLIQRTLML